MLSKDYRDIIEQLGAHGVEFVVVGAYAMGAFGYTRATGDIDILVRANRGNAERVIQALESFGAPLNQVTAIDFEKEGMVFQIGVAPLRIDLLTSIDGVSFDEISIEYHDVGGVSLPVIDLDSLLRNKRATGRLRDLADCEELEKRRDG